VGWNGCPSVFGQRGNGSEVSLNCSGGLCRWRGHNRRAYACGSRTRLCLDRFEAGRHPLPASAANSPRLEIGHSPV